MHVAFATSTAHPALTPDDQLAVTACAARGIRVSPAVWSDPDVAWSAYDAVVIRSTWDYHRRAAEFDRWLMTLGESGTAVWNPLQLLRWNANKRYLGDLAARGVPTVPTAWLTREDSASLGGVMDRNGWTDVVVKPTVSATAYGTHRVHRSEAHDVAFIERHSSAHGEVLVQPFLSEIEAGGEWSLVFIGGGFSHSVRKRPARGDFRVQAEFGGSSVAERASSGVVEAGAAVLEAVDEPWLYARVDGVETDRGLLLMELEMLEPTLFLALDGGAAARFAAALEHAMTLPDKRAR
jgi:glutathione synthase/RimK-type ligase-like ATP-grasp enzyme